MSSKSVIIIPARIGSTRLKNKPLVDIKGMSLIERVYKNAKSIIDDVFIATDSSEIIKHVNTFTDKVIKTDKNHISGTDRVYEAACNLDLPSDTLIINLQGDEPFMPSKLVKNLINSYESNDCDVITAAHKISDTSLINNPNCVKAIINKNSYAKDFLRTIDVNNYNLFYQHIGIYGYSFDILKKLVSLKPSVNELERKLEQLRFIDNNYSIYVLKTNLSIPPGIDTSEDVDAAIKYIENET